MENNEQNNVTEPTVEAPVTTEPVSEPVKEETPAVQATETVKDEPVKSNNLLLMVILILVLLGIAGGMVFYFMNKNKNTTTDGTTTSTTTTAAAVSTTFTKYSIEDDEGEAFAHVFYLSNNTLYAVPTDKSGITLGDDATTIDGKKVYKVAENVEKVYTPVVGQADYHEVLYIINNELYGVVIYDTPSSKALGTFKKDDYTNVKEVVACPFMDSWGYIVINNDDQIISEKYVDSNGEETTYIFYDELNGHYVNNVNGDVLTVKKVSSKKKDEYTVVMKFEVTYKNQTDTVEIESVFGDEKEFVVNIQVEKQGDAYSYY